MIGSELQWLASIAVQPLIVPERNKFLRFLLPSPQDDLAFQSVASESCGDKERSLKWLRVQFGRLNHNEEPRAVWLTLTHTEAHAPQSIVKGSRNAYR